MSISVILVGILYIVAVYCLGGKCVVPEVTKKKGRCHMYMTGSHVWSLWQFQSKARDKLAFNYRFTCTWWLPHVSWVHLECWLCTSLQINTTCQQESGVSRQVSINNTGRKFWAQINRPSVQSPTWCLIAAAQLQKCLSEQLVWDLYHFRS